MDDRYLAATQGAAWCRLSNWSLLELTGEDRKKFLHGFCTNEIVAMEEGQVTEAFVLDGKGKTLGYFHVACLADRLWLLGHGDQAGPVSEHLDRYLIREKVTITDRTQEMQFHLLLGELAGKQAAELGGAPVGGTLAPLTVTSLPEIEGAAIASDFAGHSVLLVGKTMPEFPSSIVEVPLQVVHAVRLQSQSPWFEIEVQPNNLPQEIDRDERTINFEKGCYLGQETVARIDSLGRVNKLLRFVSFADATVDAGATLTFNDQEVGQVLASAIIPGTNTGVASVMLKRVATKSGSEVRVGDQTLTVL